MCFFSFLQWCLESAMLAVWRTPSPVCRLYRVCCFYLSRRTPSRPCTPCWRCSLWNCHSSWGNIAAGYITPNSTIYQRCVPWWATLYMPFIFTPGNRPAFQVACPYTFSTSVLTVSITSQYIQCMSPCLPCSHCYDKISYYMTSHSGCRG